ncbi:PhzF family phenazine biosynthesis protein [Promicromonospora iranensis]|uniref:PhzF family phenazine biosynthesis protein n=1 Tax=Promicromonospora iranensis TaxID=1105144 RepID=A0ABU2CJ98_9MICO|nr:PhzF family phenazine biosynthesis protein [Promicromonospora iranensis]MDR7381424.1 PhzF family phenazine biosynthesis protein [Promicromonospora iranensis]
MDVQFFWVDVFATTALAGNPLALVPDADALPDETMQAIAREFNQSETTFVVRPERPGADQRLRSFTPAGVEVFGAGHNAMGAWIWLAQSGRLDPDRDTFVQQIGDDLLKVRVSGRSSTGAQVSMEQSAPRFLGRVEDREALAAVLGLRAEDLAGDRVAEVASTGAEHLLVPVGSIEAVDAAQPDTAGLRKLLAEAGAEGCYLYTVALDPAAGVSASARFFNPTVGIAEDPATGTAAGPLAAVLVRDGLVPDHGRIVIEQGRRLGRPSRILLSVDGPLVTITGTGILAAEGVLHL